MDCEDWIRQCEASIARLETRIERQESRVALPAKVGRQLAATAAQDLLNIMRETHARYRERANMHRGPLRMLAASDSPDRPQTIGTMAIIRVWGLRHSSILAQDQAARQSRLP
jgi:hypothetical protein